MFCLFIIETRVRLGLDAFVVCEVIVEPGEVDVKCWFGPVSIHFEDSEGILERNISCRNLMKIYDMRCGSGCSVPGKMRINCRNDGGLDMVMGILEDYSG